MTERRSSGTLEQAPPASTTVSPEPPENTEPRGAAQRPTPTARVQERPSVQLPTERSVVADALSERTVFIYGPPKIGKSTLASRFGERVIFFDTEGGLDHLSVFKTPVPDWMTFLSACAGVVAEADKWDAVAIDTMDVLASHCSVYVNAKLGIIHESDAEYGKAWSLVRQELVRPLAKLSATPGLGLIIIGHSADVEIKTRNSTYTKAVPTLGKAARETALTLSDLILFADFAPDAEGVEQRILRTKPSPYWEAGERGDPVRLPDTLPLDYEALKSAWEGKK